ncbi:hypothetical protein HHI36_015617 [Cryptolaemus montrouzieri]|uniref:Uncharacterized protein n=1 Tax=Cryptolaemus montrouzieri TaxID=559131 RepID=A0ABD2N693_9CUCU
MLKVSRTYGIVFLFNVYYFFKSLSASHKLYRLAEAIHKYQIESASIFLGFTQYNFLKLLLFLVLNHSNTFGHNSSISQKLEFPQNVAQQNWNSCHCYGTRLIISSDISKALFKLY